MIEVLKMGNGRVSPEIFLEALFLGVLEYK
jgi:hypothetical protein